MKAVKLTQMVEELNLKNLTPNVDMEKIRITLPDINRPALQLTGYFEPNHDHKKEKDDPSQTE